MRIGLPKIDGKKKIASALEQIKAVIADLEKGVSQCEKEKAEKQEKVTKKRAAFGKFESLMNDEIATMTESQNDAKSAIKRFKAMLAIPEDVEDKSDGST